MPKTSVPRVMWPRRATQLFGAAESAGPGGVVITVPVQNVTDLGRIAATAAGPQVVL